MDVKRLELRDRMRSRLKLRERMEGDVRAGAMRCNSMTFLTIVFLLISSLADAAPDALYLGAKVWTGEADGRFAEAFAVKGDRIIAVGPRARVRAMGGRDTAIFDLDGKLVVPGFIDNHTHLLSAALQLSAVDLRDAATPVEFTRRIVERAKTRPGEWILFGNWDHERWGATLPTRAWIDPGTEDTPVFVQRLDGHMGLANSAALELAGIDAETPDPPGGAIVRDARGEPTGLLKDAAMEAVFEVIPRPSVEQVDEAMQLGFEEALKYGVTQVHDMSEGDWSTLEACRRARDGNRLPIRVYAFVPLADWAKLQDFIRVHGRGDDWIRWGGVKGFVDGSLGSSTAWFYEPYSDAPDNRGLTMGDLTVLADNIRNADRAGLHVAVHAIGDRANDWLLGKFERIASENGERDRRFRIEHAQHPTTAAIRRYGVLGVIASMQPYHAIDDGRWAEKRLGAERIKSTYAFKSMLDAGVRLTFGSDWAVAPIDPLAGIDAAVMRRTIDGRNPQGWQPQQKISVAAAVRAYTAANAYAGFQEGRLGRIAPGYLADFVVLSDDIFTIDPRRIAETKVLRTVVGGVERYHAPQ